MILIEIADASKVGVFVFLKSYESLSKLKKDVNDIIKRNHNGQVNQIDSISANLRKHSHHLMVQLKLKCDFAGENFLAIKDIKCRMKVFIEKFFFCKTRNQMLSSVA